MAIRDATIAIDFDGTVVTHAYPEIGEDAGAVPVLKELTGNGCRLILFSMRHGKLLDQAAEWFRRNGLAEGPCRPLHRRQQFGMSPAVRGRRETPRGRLGPHPRTVGEGRVSGLTAVRVHTTLKKRGFFAEASLFESDRTVMPTNSAGISPRRSSSRWRPSAPVCPPCR